MKKLSVIFLITVLFFNCNDEHVDEEEIACDNGTYIGDVILSTQQEVDDFGALCFTKIDGNLIIGNPDFDLRTNFEVTNIESLFSMEGLMEITDGLTIQACPLLLNLKGLENLISIGESSDLKINECRSLSTIAQLSSLVNNNEENNIQLFGNEMLTSLNGLEGYTAANQVIIVGSGIVNLEGLNNVAYLRALRLSGNTLLTSLYGVHNVSEMELLGITHNNMLTSLSEINDQVKLKYLGLYNNNSITSLHELNRNFNNEMLWVTIRYNEGLNSIGNMEGVESIGSLFIRDNTNLVTLGSFPDLVEVGALFINDNSNLTNLNGLESLLQVQGRYGFSNNVLLLDFCGIENLLVNGNGANYDENGMPILNYLQNNAYNPTVQDIIDGNCSQ